MSSISNRFLAGGSGSTIVDFGPSPGTNMVTVTVGNQPYILSSSIVQAFMMSDSTVSGSAGHNEYEHTILSSQIKLTCGNINTSSGRLS